MIVRRDPKTGFWNIEGLDSDQLFDVHEALVMAQLRGDAVEGSRKYKTVRALHETILEATNRGEA